LQTRQNPATHSHDKISVAANNCRECGGIAVGRKRANQVTVAAIAQIWVANPPEVLERRF
jgi:hypothetical protein